MRMFFLILLIAAQTAAAQPSLIDPIEISGVPITFSAADQDINPLFAGTEGKKSVPLAILYSLLLPGMGELYAGNYSTGKYLTAAEGGLWITLIGLDRYGSWLQDDARTFAAAHAGINPAGKNDQYFVDIGNYNTIYDFNQEALRNRNPYKLYEESSGFYWSWDSRSSREYFRDVRIKSDNMFNSVNFVAAAIAINHLVSAINAARVAIKHNENADHAGRLEIHAGVMGGIGNPHGIMVSISKSF